jgi:hypothetical protein
MSSRLSINTLIVICAVSAALAVTVADLYQRPTQSDPIAESPARQKMPDPLFLGATATGGEHGRTAAPQSTASPSAVLTDLIPPGCTAGWTQLECNLWADTTAAGTTDRWEPTAGDALQVSHRRQILPAAAHSQFSGEAVSAKLNTAAADPRLPPLTELPRSSSDFNAPASPDAQRPQRLPPVTGVLLETDLLQSELNDAVEELLLPPAEEPLHRPDALESLLPLDPLESLSPLDAAHASKRPAERPLKSAEASLSADQDPHAQLFLEECYPSAQACAKCHPKHYDEWRVSSHAYASVSPMFQRFEQAMQDLTRGTVGAFCVRCHAPVATQLNRPAYASILDAPLVIREGITCVACHRVNEAYGRTHGDRRIEPGDIHAPVRGSSAGSGIQEAIVRAAELKLKTSAEQGGPGQNMHGYGGFFAPLSRSDFCAPCHQVAVHPGIGLEIVHAQFRAGPAHAKGITCQDCHMGAVPGKAEGYEFDHCAVINDRPFGKPRKHANHMFWGPNYSIAHPGIFPHNKDANRYSPRQWLAFEYRSGWGTQEFERSATGDMIFPKPWETVDDRIDGRKVIDANLEHMSMKRGAAVLTLAAGAQVQGPFFQPGTPMTSRPLRFSYRIDNISQGHNVPTGSLGAQPQMWLNVALVGPEGARVWESGYLDSNGDLADLNSVDVAEHRLQRDSQLFNLQTKFLINNVRGTDREAPVPLNFSLDQLVFLRPGAVPVSVLNHPPLIRMEAHSIEPLGHRIARYRVPPEALSTPGPYRLSVRMRSRPEPPYFMRLVGASPEMIRRLNENIVDFAASSETFMVLPQ